jgi:hypothetical protein
MVVKKEQKENMLKKKNLVESNYLFNKLSDEF